MQRTDGADKMFETFEKVFLSLAEDFGLSEKTREALRDILREGVSKGQEDVEDDKEEILTANATYCIKTTITGTEDQLRDQIYVMSEISRMVDAGDADISTSAVDVTPEDAWFS